MKNTTKRDLLGIIAEAQDGSANRIDRGTAPATVMIGYIGANNMVCHDGILITDAPAAIVTAAMAWVDVWNHERQVEMDEGKTNVLDRVRVEVHKGGLLFI